MSGPYGQPDGAVGYVPPNYDPNSGVMPSQPYPPNPQPYAPGPQPYAPNPQPYVPPPQPYAPNPQPYAPPPQPYAPQPQIIIVADPSAEARLREERIRQREYEMRKQNQRDAEDAVCCVACLYAMCCCFAIAASN